MTKKEIIIFAPSIEDGGVEKNLYNISNYLAEKIDNISLITSTKKSKKFFSKKINFCTSNSFFFSKNLTKRKKILSCLYFIFKNFIVKRKKILIFSFQGNIYALIFAFIFRIKIIVRSNTSPYSWSKNFFKNYVFKLFYNYADIVIVNSNEFKKEMKKLFNIKVTKIYNPLDTHVIDLKLKKKINFNFFEKKSLNLINIGRLTDQKNQIIILKAINEIKKDIKIKLAIIGKGNQYNNLKKFICENNLKTVVKLLGYKTNPYPFLKKSDIFILSSKFEGLPNVLLESIYLKKKIISSDCPTGPREILVNDKCGFLYPNNDYLALAEILKKFKKNNFKKINNYPVKDLERFDFDINCNKYLKIIYKTLLKI
jgi:glycosyltransferase involved in cell wall biosynthesis